MGLFSKADASDALEDLLERERFAVLDGRFDVLERMSAEKERLVRSFARTGVAPPTLARLKAGSERNGRLLEAMRTGIMAAQKRLQAMQEQKKPLQTYDSSGRKSAITTTPKSPGHRA